MHISAHDLEKLLIAPQKLNLGFIFEIQNSIPAWHLATIVALRSIVKNDTS